MRRRDRSPAGVRLLPADPVLFGEPLPVGHPWASPTTNPGGWERLGTIRAHIARPDGCNTLCRRGLPRCTSPGCRPMRVAPLARATCARCIRLAVFGDDALRPRASALAAGTLTDERCRIWRAIAWWRCCGAWSTSPPDWIAGFFAADAVVVEARP